MRFRFFNNKLFSGSRQRNLIVKFSFSMGLIVLLFLLSIFTGLFLNNKKMIETELLARARSHFSNIVLTRSWNAMYGGVYIEKTEGIESNPYLANPDIETVDGKIYTKKNPALMTREISELADISSEYQFHITSLNPINPSNSPDEFEIAALRSFEDGAVEMYTKDVNDGNLFYRYMGPLVTEQSCLQCHSEQGYIVGDIRGGISVKFQIDDIERSIVFNRNIIIALSAVSILLLLGIFYFLIFRLNRNLDIALQQIRDMADKDSLTSLFNRRYLYEWAGIEISRAKRYKYEISLIMIDIDFFKRINDNHGHLSGDHVLMDFSRIMLDSSRETDIVARYGGEEFLIVLTNTGEEGAIKFANKLLLTIRDRTFELPNGKEEFMTASMGIACVDYSNEEVVIALEDLVDRADNALYQAKKNGRNQIIVHKKSPEE